MKLIPRTCLAATLLLAPAATGCASWAQEWKANPAQSAASLAQYVATFLQIAQGIWAVVQPLVGGAGSTADKTFASGVQAVQHALLAEQDAAQAYAAATSGTDAQLATALTAAVTALKSAVADGEQIIARNQGSAPAPAKSGATIDDLAHAGAVIAAWH